MAPSVSATPLSVVAARRGEVQQAEHGRSRESNLAGGVWTSWSAALTCGNAEEVRGLEGVDRPDLLTASTHRGDLGVVTRSRLLSLAAGTCKAVTPPRRRPCARALSPRPPRRRVQLAPGTAPGPSWRTSESPHPCHSWQLTVS